MRNFGLMISEINNAFTKQTRNGSLMQAPNVKDNTVADVEDNHLHCRSCGFKIPVTTDSRFCSICANKSENILKFVYYLEMLAFAVILGYVILGYLYTAIEFIEWVISNNKSVSDPDDQYRFDEDLFIVIPVSYTHLTLPTKA